MDITITVLKWRQYQPRTDAKHCSWFRIENRLAFNPAMDLPHAQRWIWILILSLCSESRSEVLKVSVHYLARLGGTDEFEVRAALTAFAAPSRNWIELEAPQDAVLSKLPRQRTTNVTSVARSRDTSVALRNVTKRNGTEEELLILPGIGSKTGGALLVQIPLERQSLLVEKFGEAAVREAAMDAAQWLASNPRRKIKSMGAFLRNWLAKNREAPPPKSQSRFPVAVGDISGAPTENVEMVPLPGPIPPWRKK